MRKMTKKAAILAAMSAMTAASASMAFAANQEENLSALDKADEVKAAAEAYGEWNQKADGNWTFTKEGGKKLQNTWAEIDGIWYYFDGENMAQDDFLVLDDKGYFFDENGRMATGWQKITSKMDAYSDIEIADEWYDPTNNYYVQVDDDHEYDYHDFVWCYFDENGVAKHNEWFEDTNGLWYYFDGDVMVKNVYNYRINPDNYDVVDSEKVKIYGFDENGAMMVGWNYKEVETTWNNPTADDKGKIWYYYNSDGQMQKSGWKQIEGKWYLFANANADLKNPDLKDQDGVGTRSDDWLIGGYPLIVNSYVASYNKDKYEYFYVNGNGELLSGVQKVPKNTYKVVFYQNIDGVKKYLDVAYQRVKTSKDIYVNFGEKNYAAKEAVVDEKFYTMGTDNTVAAKFDNSNVWKVNNTVLNADKFFDADWTPSSTQWSFTDNGSAVSSSAANEDTAVGYYVNKTTFAKMSVDDYTAGLEAGSISANDYIALPILDAENPTKDKVEQARLAAVTAYTDKNTAMQTYNTKLADWASVNGDVTVTTAVTGYDATKAPSLATFAGSYNDLVSDKNNKEAAKNAAYKAYTLALDSGASSTKVDALKTAYDKAADEYAEYVKVCDRVEGDALYDSIMANATTYNDYKTAEQAYNDAVKIYNAAAKAVKDFNYKYFVNQWDAAKTTDPTNFRVVGELVKNAFIGRSDDVLYLADADGNFVTDKAVLIDTNANIVYGDTTYQNAYILFGSDGKAICGYDGTRKSITIGGVTYWATNETPVTVGKADDVTVFISNKMIDSKDNGIVQR